MLRHILRINRLMYHHYIVNLGEEETVKNIYEKQKQDSFKGDAFMGIDINEDEMKNTPKEI